MLGIRPGVGLLTWILIQKQEAMLFLMPWMQQRRHQMWNRIEPVLDKLIELWSRPVSYVWMSVIIGIIAAVQNWPV